MKLNYKIDVVGQMPSYLQPTTIRLDVVYQMPSYLQPTTIRLDVVDQMPRYLQPTTIRQSSNASVHSILSHEQWPLTYWNGRVVFPAAYIPPLIMAV